jgi:hypothetical protein
MPSIDASGTIQQAIRAVRALAAHRVASLFCAKRGRSSVVEHQLPKLSVVGSIPIARSSLRCFGWQAAEPSKFRNHSFKEGGRFCAALQRNWLPRRNLPLIFLFDRPGHTG